MRLYIGLKNKNKSTYYYYLQCPKCNHCIQVNHNQLWICTFCSNKIGSLLKEGCCPLVVDKEKQIGFYYHCCMCDIQSQASHWQVRLDKIEFLAICDTKDYLLMYEEENG